MKTFASLFSGGGGADLGAKAAGYELSWAVEYDAAIADVYRANIGNHILTADVCAIDYATMPRVDWLHASPVCTRYSMANKQRSESDLDMRTAAAVVRAIDALSPESFTLENVPQYGGSDAYRLICQALDRNGYMWHAATLNSADYGVPQTRRRLVVRASKGLLRGLPLSVAWVDWYAAIADLIPTLPPAAFTPWQLARLPSGVTGNVLFSNQCGTDNYSTLNRVQDFEPSFSVLGHQRTVSAYRAFILNSQESSAVLGLTQHIGKPSRIDWLNTGNVVAMTPRALARFQSFPDSYTLPDKKALACKIIGNAVPPLLMQAVGMSFA